MNDTKTQYTDEQLPVSSERTFPADQYPRKYVHSVINDLHYVVQAVYALRAAGYNPNDIHVMSSWDFVDAFEHKQQQQSRLSMLLARFAAFMDEGFADVYLREACRGHHVLAVRLARKEQIQQVKDVLSTHHAYLIKYVDMWTVAG